MNIIEFQTILKVKLSPISKRIMRREKWKREFPEFKNSVQKAEHSGIQGKKQPEADLGRSAE